MPNFPLVVLHLSPKFILYKMLAHLPPRIEEAKMSPKLVCLFRQSNVKQCVRCGEYTICIRGGFTHTSFTGTDAHCCFVDVKRFYNKYLYNICAAPLALVRHWNRHYLSNLLETIIIIIIAWIFRFFGCSTVFAFKTH